jgi:leucine dehydrogenase
MIIDKMSKEGFDSIYFCNDTETGLKAIISVHNINLGPALGGCRFYPYRTENDAIVDVMNLSRGMTYKAAISGMNLGGGKSVIIGDPSKEKSENLFLAFGRYLNELNGKYITAEDSGTCQEDMDIIKKVSKFVTGISPKNGGSGDPSPWTALGVLQGIKASCKFAYGDESLKDRRVAVQGVGHVGYYLSEHLAKEGAEITVCDVDKSKVEVCVKEFGAKEVSCDDIYSVDCDIFAPCALAWAVNDDTIKQFKCKIIAGAANNQLKTPSHSNVLFEKGIVYAPDYAINAGGLISVGEEWYGYNIEKVTKKVNNIYSTVENILERSKTEKTPTHIIADKIAEERFLKAKK